MPKQKDIYSIGQFAELSRMTISQLRYLDEKDVLKPDSRDEFSGYRYYTYGQLEKLLCIRTLRGLDMPLETIVKIYKANDLEFLLGALTENLVRIEEKWQRALWEYEQNTLYIREVVKGISVLERCQNKGRTIEIVEVPRMCVLSTRRYMEAHETMVFSDRFIELYDMCEKQRLHYDVGVYAVNHCSYLTQFKGERIDLETMVTLKHAIEGHKNVRTFSGFKGVSTMYVGPYEQMLPAYEDCILWAKEQGIEIMAQSVEEYILAAGSIMDPDRYITRLILPFKGSVL